jgi:hypothetical protein
LKPLSIQNKASFDEYDVDLQAEATLEKLTRFLYGLQSSRLLLHTPRFRLSAAPGSGGEAKLRLTLTVARVLLPSAGRPRPAKLD